MMTFCILVITLLTLGMLSALVLAVGGAAFLAVFGDVLVCGLIIGLIVKLFVKKKKN